MKNLFLIGVLIFFFHSANSQSKYYERLYKWGDIQELRKVSTLETEFIYAGNIKNSGGEWQGQIYITNYQGDTISIITYDNSYGYIGFSNFTETNNLFAFTGNMTQPIGGDNVQTLLLIWDKNNYNFNLYYVGNSDANSTGRSIIWTQDGNLIIVGSKDWQPYAVKTDTLGNIIWEQVYDNYPLLNWLTDVIPVPNEQAYYVIGTVGFNVMNGDILLAKISDTTGEMLWDTTYSFGGVDGANEIVKSQYGGYIIGGAAEGFSNVYFKGMVMKLSNDLDIEWYNSQLFENCGCGALKELPDGSIIAASCNDPQGEYAQMQIIKLSGADGSILWRRTYGGSWHDYAYDLALAPDGGFIVAGRQDTIVPGAPIGHASAWVLKTNCMGLLTQPAAGFSYEPQGANQIQFTNLSLYAYPDSIDGGYYIWDFGDGSPPYLCGQGYAPCTGNILTHQYAAPGVYTATLTAIVCSDTSVVQALIDTQGAGGTVGIAPPNPITPLPPKGGNTILVYPNPAQSLLTLAGWQNMVAFTVYAISGALVLRQSPVIGSQIGIAQLPAGLYIAEAQYKNGSIQRQKLLIHR